MKFQLVHIVLFVSVLNVQISVAQESPSGGAITANELDVATTCRRLAALASQGQLDKLQILGRSPDTAAEKNARLSGELEQIYDIPLRPNATTRFARFWTGRTCASKSIYNLDRLISLGSDAQELDEQDGGILEVMDPNEQLRWVGWGGTEYVIKSKEGYFIVTADSQNPNDAELFSWIRPDNFIQPLCTLAHASERTYLTPQEASASPECNAVTRGARPIRWAVAPSSSPLYNLGNVARVEQAEVAIGKGKSLVHIGRITFDSTAGCGTPRASLFHLNDANTELLKDPLSSPLSVGTDMFSFKGHYYLLTSFNDLKRINAGVVSDLCKVKSFFALHVRAPFQLTHQAP